MLLLDRAITSSRFVRLGHPWVTPKRFKISNTFYTTR